MGPYFKEHHCARVFCRSLREASHPQQRTNRASPTRYQPLLLACVKWRTRPRCLASLIGCISLIRSAAPYPKLVWFLTVHRCRQLTASTELKIGSPLTTPRRSSSKPATILPRSERSSSTTKLPKPRSPCLTCSRRSLQRRRVMDWSTDISVHSSLFIAYYTSLAFEECTRGFGTRSSKHREHVLEMLRRQR